MSKFLQQLKKLGNTNQVRAFVISLLLLPCLNMTATAGNGKLLATSGLSQVEGSGGGGLTPWATLAGYDSDSEFSVNAVSTGVYVDDFQLQALGGSASWHDRLEVSYTRHNFDIKPSGGELRQNIFGAKLKLSGDVVYSKFSVHLSDS